MKKTIQIIMLVLLSNSIVGVEVFAKEFKIENLNKKPFRWAQYVANKTQGKPVSEKYANRLKNAILADNLVSENEKKLLRILISGKYSKITIGAKKSLTFKPNDIIFTNIISDAAVNVLRSIQVVQYKDPLLAKWHSGIDGYKELLSIYQSSAAGKAKVSDFYVEMIIEHWNRSTWKDGYAVLKSFLQTERGKISKLNGVDYRFAKSFLYEVMLKADKAAVTTVGGIPDPLYQDLKPKEK